MLINSYNAIYQVTYKRVSFNCNLMSNQLHFKYYTVQVL